MTESMCIYPGKKPLTAYRNGCRCRRCKDANNQWQKGYHRRNPGKAAQYLRRRKYGMEPEDFQRLMEKQGTLCAICRSCAWPLVVDHCHESGEVRGLLCNNCNTAIGLLKHNVKRCQSVIAYLSREAQ